MTTTTTSFPTSNFAQPSLFDLPSTPIEPRSLVYNGAAPAQKSDTSRAAARRVAGKAPSIRMLMLGFVRGRGEDGATSQEAGDFLARHKGKPAENFTCRISAAARLTELKLGGFIEDSGRRRPSRDDCPQIVWVATGKQGDGSICERTT